MSASTQISAAIFSEFLKCPTKAHLLAIGEPAPGAFFVDIETRISFMYKVVAERQLHTGAKVADLFEFGQLWCSLDYDPMTHYVTAIQSSMTVHCRSREMRFANRRTRRRSETLSLSCFHPGTSRIIPTACSFVLARLRYRRPSGYCQTPER